MPADLVYADIDPGIERESNETGVRPARRPLAGTLQDFAQFSPYFLVAERGEHRQADLIALVADIPVLRYEMYAPTAR